MLIKVTRIASLDMEKLLIDARQAGQQYAEGHWEHWKSQGSRCDRDSKGNWGYDIPTYTGRTTAGEAWMRDFKVPRHFSSYVERGMAEAGFPRIMNETLGTRGRDWYAVQGAFYAGFSARWDELFLQRRREVIERGTRHLDGLWRE